jgi:prepilin-type N-terminal cleavage/methylation domain-containing protein
MRVPRGDDRISVTLHPHRADSGFSLIELLVVVTLIAVLAAVALPVLLSQQAKAHDSAAKSDARTMVSALEGCYTSAQRYDGCATTDTGVPVGTGRGEVEVGSSGSAFVVTAHSRSGNDFIVEKTADGTFVRRCVDTGQARGGCTDASW